MARGRLDQAEADLYLAYAFGAPGNLPAAYRSDVPWEGTLPLLRLRERLAAMPRGVDRAAIREVLDSSAAGSCSGTSGGPNTFSSTYFHIEYDTIAGGLTINHYATSLDTSWNAEVNTFGWAAPPVAPTPAPGNKYHVVVAALGPSLYGFVHNVGTHAGPVGNNPNTSWNDVDAQASCMALNRDYSTFPSPAQASLDATTAHEFAHSLQYGYGALDFTDANYPDPVFIEGGATWMEDEVFDGSDDNYHYLWPNFTDDMGSYGSSPYPYWITFRGLTEQYGAGVAGGGEQVMQDFWEETSKNTGNNLSAMQTAMTNKGTNLSDAYHAYAIAVKFNRACTGGYVYPYCLEEGPAYVAAKGATPVQGTIPSVPGTFPGSVPDNYALNWVALPTSGGPYDVTLRNISTDGGQLRGTVACDTGSALALSPFPAVAGPSSATTVSAYSPSGCSSVVAVITNQAQTADNPSTSLSRRYTVAVGVPASDTTPPETTITSGPSGTVNSTSASFSFTSSEPGSTFACSLDGGAYSACSSPRSYTGLGTGPHTFRVRATDSAGNVDGSPAERTWTVAPQVHTRQVSLSLKKHLRARGSVTASDGFTSCLDGEAVQIQRRKRGNWSTVKAATTRANGSYRAKLPDKPGKYRAVLAESAASSQDLCRAAQSAARKHRHG